MPSYTSAQASKDLSYYKPLESDAISINDPPTTFASQMGKFTSEPSMSVVRMLN